MTTAEIKAVLNAMEYGSTIEIAGLEVTRHDKHSFAIRRMAFQIGLNTAARWIARQPMSLMTTK